MDPAKFFAASGVVIVAGKGGVGKTTVTAALARAASLEGLSALIVEIEGKAGLARLFGLDDLDYEERVLIEGDEAAGVGEVRARALTADVALLEYLDAHSMGRVAKRLVSSGVLDVLATVGQVAASRATRGRTEPACRCPRCPGRQRAMRLRPKLPERARSGRAADVRTAARRRPPAPGWRRSPAGPPRPRLGAKCSARERGRSRPPARDSGR